MPVPQPRIFLIAALLSAALAISGGRRAQQRQRHIAGDLRPLQTPPVGRYSTTSMRPTASMCLAMRRPPSPSPRQSDLATRSPFTMASTIAATCVFCVIALSAPSTASAGTFTYTVWQDVAVRSAFVRDLVLRTFTVIAVLIGTVALVVWFGVSIGLRPLLDLEDAISKRSSDDLRPDPAGPFPRKRAGW